MCKYILCNVCEIYLQNRKSCRDMFQPKLVVAWGEFYSFFKLQLVKFRREKVYNFEKSFFLKMRDNKD